MSWTRRGLDGLPADPGSVALRLTRDLAAGDVLVLHDGGPAGGAAAARALPRLLEAMAARNLRGVSLPEALGARIVNPGMINPGMVMSGLVNPALVMPGMVNPALVNSGLVIPEAGAGANGAEASSAPA